MALVSVLCDSREPTWVQQLGFGGVATAVTPLDAGDLLLACDDDALIVVERKTASDFLNSLKDGRLIDQLRRLRDVTPWSYLALCGSLMPGPNGKAVAEGRETGFNWASVAGALLQVQEVGVHVLWVPTDADYERAVLQLANRDRKAIRYAPCRDLTVVGDTEQILSALPGIGPERVQQLLKYCGNAAFALQYLTDLQTTQEERIPGIGPATKARIRKALGLDDETVLAVIVDVEGQLAKLRRTTAA